RHTRFSRDWSSDVCSSDLLRAEMVKIANGQLDTPFSKKFYENVMLRLVDSANDNGNVLRHRPQAILNGRLFDPEKVRAVPKQERSEARRVGKGCRAGGRRT